MAKAVPNNSDYLSFYVFNLSVIYSFSSNTKEAKIGSYETGNSDLFICNYSLS